MNRTSKGFSLIEVICAIGLIGIIAVSFFPLMNMSIKQLSSIESKNEMSFIGEMVIEKLKTSTEKSISTLNSLDDKGEVQYVDDDFDSNKYNCNLIKTYSSEGLIEFLVKVELKGMECVYIEYRASIPKK